MLIIIVQNDITVFQGLTQRFHFIIGQAEDIDK